MARTEAEELVEDATIDDLPERSRFVSFLRGTLLGLVASGVTALGLTLSHPLPENLPGVGSVRVEGSGVTPEAAAPALEPVASAADASASGDSVPAVDAEVSGAEPSEAQSESPVLPTETLETTDPSGRPASGSETVAESQPAARQVPEQPTTEPEPEATDPVATEAATPEAPLGAGGSDGDGEQVALVSPTEPVTPEPTEPAPEIKLSGPASEVNARVFEAPQTAPLLAVVLDDAGNGAVEADALALLTMPLTLAIGPDGEASARLADAARAANHEVLVRMPMAISQEAPEAGALHSGLSGPELAALSKRYLAMMPAALGVTPTGGSPVLKDRDAMASIVDPVNEHGFVWIGEQAGSGSTVASLASEAGFGFAEMGRAIGPGATGDQIFNGLEAAAFLARQRGSAIVRIPSSREALTALLRWGLERDRRPVWFAPVSAVLKRRADTR